MMLALTLALALLADGMQLPVCRRLSSAPESEVTQVRDDV